MRAILILTFVVRSIAALAQTDTPREQWKQISNDLSTYEGTLCYCRTKGFRDQAVSVFTQLDGLSEDFSVQKFHQYLRRECMILNDIERNRAFLEEGELTKEVSDYERRHGKFLDALAKEISRTAAEPINLSASE